MDLPSPEDVLAAIDAFLERHDMSPTRFGAESTGDANLVNALRGGSSPSLKRLHRIRDYIIRKDVELQDGDGSSAGCASPGKCHDLTAQAMS